MLYLISVAAKLKACMLAIRNLSNVMKNVPSMCNVYLIIDFQLPSGVDLQALTGYNSPDLTANWVAAHSQGPLTAAIQAAGIHLSNRYILT